MEQAQFFAKISKADYTVYRDIFFSNISESAADHPQGVMKKEDLALRNIEKNISLYCIISLANFRITFAYFMANRGESDANGKRELRARGRPLNNPACKHTTLQALPPPDKP